MTESNGPATVSKLALDCVQWRALGAAMSTIRWGRAPFHEPGGEHVGHGVGCRPGCSTPERLCAFFRTERFLVMRSVGFLDCAAGPLIVILRAHSDFGRSFRQAKLGIYTP